MSAFRVYRHGLLVGARDFAIFWTWKSWIGGWMLRIITNVLLWGLMGRFLGSPEKLKYLLIGNAAVAGVGTFVVAAATWDRMDGTYPLLVISPSSLVPALIGRTSIWMFGWIASASISFVFVNFAFDLHVSLGQTVFSLLIIALLSVSTLCMTVFFGAVAAMAPKLRNIINSLIVTTFMALCGVSVPLTFWPVWIQWIAYFLPVTHGLLGIRLLLEHASYIAIERQIMLEGFIGLGWLMATIFTCDRLAERGRSDGSIQLTT